jgi:hypothetical protein
MPVPEDQRPPGANIINIAIAIGIKNQTAFGTINENGFGANRLTRPHGTVYPPGYYAHSSIKQFLRGCQIHTHHFLSFDKTVDIYNDLKNIKWYKERQEGI